MKVTLLGIFEAEGDPAELAAYTFCVLETLQMKAEKEKEDEVHKEMNLLDLFKDIPFEELFKHEMEDKQDDGSGV